MMGSAVAWGCVGFDSLIRHLLEQAIQRYIQLGKRQGIF